MDPVINTAHVVNGALVLATSLLLTLRSFRSGFERLVQPIRQITQSPDHQIAKSRRGAPVTEAVAVARARRAHPRLCRAGKAAPEPARRRLHARRLRDGERRSARPVAVCGLLLGTGLVAGGASAFNQVMERDLDALMKRTRGRPMPDQRLQPVEGPLFGSAITLIGLLLIVASSTCSPRRWRWRRS